MILFLLIFSDANLRFFDNRDFSYDKNGRYNFNVYFLTNQGGETVRLFFYHTVYNSEPGYGKKVQMIIISISNLYKKKQKKTKKNIKKYKKI